MVTASSGFLLGTPEIFDALEPHKEWLEELCLDHDEDFPYDGFDDDEPVALSFKGFKTLKHFKVAPLYLFSHIDFWHKTEFHPEVDEGLRTYLVGRLPQSLQKVHIMQ